jgi:hypothetical protein
MKCPYNSNQITIHHNKPIKYEKLDVVGIDDVPDVLHCTNNDYSDSTTFYLHDCLREECGAYQNGRCVRTA